MSFVGICGAGRRKALRLLQREPLQHRKRTDGRGVVSGQTGTSRLEDLVLKWPLNHSHQGIKPEPRLRWQMLIFLMIRSLERYAGTFS